MDSDRLRMCLTIIIQLSIVRWFRRKFLGLMIVKRLEGKTDLELQSKMSLEVFIQKWEQRCKIAVRITIRKLERLSNYQLISQQKPVFLLIPSSMEDKTNKENLKERNHLSCLSLRELSPGQTPTRQKEND